MPEKPVGKLTGAPDPPRPNRFAKGEELLRGKVLVPDDLGGTLLRDERTDIISFDDWIGTGSFPGGFGTGDRPLSDLPNYEKMTRTERSIQGFLAGNADSPVAKVLGKMSEGFLGKVFTVLDSAAEFIERTSGLGAQALAAAGDEEHWEEFTHNLRNAWGAGTFAADFTNLPIRENGQITFNEDLPGIDGVINARRRLTELVELDGLSYEDALEQVRGEVYEDAGALALRMQLHDAFFHIVGDPLNLFLPRLKLVDATKLRAIQRAAGKAVPRLADDALKLVDDAVAAGTMTADKAADARTFINSLERMTPADERWLKLSGALELNGRPGEILAKSELTGLDKFLRGRLNPFGITATSRAHGLAVNLTDNVIAALAHIDDPEEAIRMIVAAADGTFDPRIAHMVITHEGAMARGLLEGFSAEAQKLGNAWAATSNNRTIFNFLRTSMGDDGADLLARMLKADDMQPIFARAMESLGDKQDDFFRLLEASGIDPNITPEKLFEIFEPLAKGGMLNTETFTGRLINEIGDFAAKGAAAKFGVPTRGFIAKMADLMKSAESMAFLRINPGYFVRNLVNGEMTGLGRMGIFYRFVPGGMKKMLDRIGISPTRLRAGFGIAGDVPAHYKKVAGGQEAIKAIDDVLRGIEMGDPSAMTNFAEKIRGVDLPLDFGALSAKVESNQSFALTSRGIFEYMTNYHQAPDMPPALINALGDSRAAALKKAVASSWNDLEIDDVFLKPAASGLNTRAVLDDASAAFGEDIMRTIPAPEAQAMADDLIGAYNKGGATAMRDTVERLRAETALRYSEALKGATDDITRNIIDHVQNGGIDSALHYHSGMLDEFWGTVHGKYIDEFGAVFEQIKNADPEIAGALWNTVRARTRTYWDESWELFEAQEKAITKGLRAWGKDAKNPFPHLDDYGRSFKEWRGGWKKFWKTRDDLIDEWVEARKAGKPVDYEVVRSQVDEAYKVAVSNEDAAFRRMDELMAGYAPEEFRSLYMAGRNEVAGTRQVMREHVQNFMNDPLGDGRAYIDLTKDEQIGAFQRFWKDRKIYIDEISQAEDKTRAAMFGDLEARASYASVMGGNKSVDDAVGIWDLMRQEGELPGTVTIPEGPGKFRTLDVEGTTRITGAGDVADNTGEFIISKVEGQFIVSDPATGFMTDGPYDSLDDLIGFYKPDELVDDIAARLAKRAEVPPELFEEALKKARAAWNTGERDLNVLRGEFDEGMQEAIRIATEDAGKTPDDFLKTLLNAPGEGIAHEGQFAANAISDAEGVIGRIVPVEKGLYELWNMKGSKALDAIGESIINRGKLPPIKLDDLDDAGKAAVRSYVNQSKANLTSSRYQAIKFGEWKRDSGLLNYSRRLNYNTWLGTIMPFEFWTTTSIRKWVLHTLNRPTMTSFYLRTQDFLDKGFRPEAGLPQRLQGQIRINAPMLPDFLGNEIFIDPLSLALPFKQWEYALDSLTQDEQRDVGRARRVLEELLQDGEITEQQYALALENESGPAWERAITLARLDDTEGRTSMFDFMSMLTAPHAPIAWAHQMLKGTPEEIRTFLPLTRTVKGVTALLGIGPAGGVNIEGNIREHLGLPRVDQYDDYRTNRMLANMVAALEITAQEAGLAMTSQQGEHYEEAKRRAGIEYGIGALGSTIGMPMKAYPPGEEHLRKLKDDYEAAWDLYNSGDDTALNDFYRENPDYESRQLALEFEPEQQLQRFLIDEIWNIWNDLPVQHKRDVADGLGEVFQTAFLNKDTRSTDNISSDMLQAWLQIMGGEIPGKAEWDQGLHPIELTDPAIAKRLDAFYLTRSQNFRYNENVAPLWDTYFKLDKAARKEYFREHPILQQYIDWRNSFMFRNPELAPYIEDDPKKLPVYETLEELQEAQQAQPDFTWMEWQNVLTLPMWRLTRDMMRYGDTLGDSEIAELTDISQGMGIEVEELLFRLEGAYEEAEGVLSQGAPASTGTNGAEGAALPVLDNGTGQPLVRLTGDTLSPEDKTAVPPSFVPLIAEAQAQLQAQGFYTNELLGRVVDAGKEAGMVEDDSVERLFEIVGEPTAEGLDGPVRVAPEIARNVRQRIEQAGTNFSEEFLALTGLAIPLGVGDYRGGVVGPVETQQGQKFFRRNPPFQIFGSEPETSDAVFVAMHETGHVADNLAVGPDPSTHKSQTTAFRNAVKQVGNMKESEYRGTPYDGTVVSIKQHPGILGNPRWKDERTEEEGTWGGYGELYANIIAWSGGYAETIPPQLRSHFMQWTK